MADFVVLGPDRRAEFDACVTVARQPEFLQTWGWGDLKNATGWRAHRLLVPGPDGAWLGACSVLERRLPGLGPLLYAPRGPIVDWDDAAAVPAVLTALGLFARSRRAIALKLDPGVPAVHAGCAEALGRHGWRRLSAGPSFESVQPRFHMQLPLQGRTEDDLLAGMHPKTRYNIRLAERRGVRVRAGGAADIDPFYAVLEETARRDRFLVRGRPYFAAMWRTCLAAGLGWLLLAEADGQLLAGAIIFRLGNTAWYLYGASANHRRELMPAYAVQWEAIRRARAAGCTLYDFRGVSGDLDEANPLYGLYRFKRGFGAELVEFVGEWDRPVRPLTYLLAQHALPVVQQVAWRLRRRARGVQPAEA